MYLNMFKEVNSSSNMVRVNQKNTECRLFKITGHKSVMGQYKGKPVILWYKYERTNNKKFLQGLVLPDSLFTFKMFPA